MNAMTPVDVAHAALLEAGRPDLADLIMWFDDEDGGYLEVNDEILVGADWEVVNRAETLARAFIGRPPIVREAWA